MKYRVIIESELPDVDSVDRTFNQISKATAIASSACVKIGESLQVLSEDNFYEYSEFVCVMQLILTDIQIRILVKE